ncbi:MAG: LptF/LptG family permease [Bacteroidia bacterium]
MKKLNKLIAFTFFRSFLPTFFVVMFILLMQFLWLYVDDLAGKGLNWFVILKLMFYFSASIIPMALPLSILLSSIMTFGNLGETYELVAAKAAGVSIWRIFRPMMTVMVGISIFAFFTSNILIPKANLKYGSLLYDIRQQKPAVLIKEGVFYNGIEGITLYIGKKDKRTEELSDIIIFDRRNGTTHSTVLTAEKGRITVSEDKRFMFLTLFNGARYEELERQVGYNLNFPHTTLTFHEEQIVFDMYDFKLNRTDESLFKDNFQMLNILQLSTAIDSLRTAIYFKGESLNNNLLQFFHLNDSLYRKYKAKAIFPKSKDIVMNAETSKNQIINNAMNEARSAKGYVEFATNETADTRKNLVRHKIEWHRKFTLSVACIVMFFIGAPFGSIIRKGGFGMPVVVSVLFYIVFHILTITGEKMARTESATPISGMWLSILVLVPVGFFFTYQAANDSGIFDKTTWVNLFKKILFINRFRSK